MAAEGKYTVLVVDDEPDAVEFVRAIMEDAGYEVMSASNGEECKRCLRKSTPDLMVLDVNMPGQAGFYVLKDLKSDPRTRDMPIIMLTGVAQQSGIPFNSDDLAEFLGCEPDAYLEKPVDPSRLSKVARDLLGA
jgi:CheY-like chemotaxis protein